MTITIARVTRKQFDRLLPELIAVYDSAYEELPDYAYHGAEAVRDYLEWLYRGDPKGFFVVCDDSRPVAFESVHGTWHDRQGNVLTEIHELVISRGYQGKRIGGMLLRMALDYARSLGKDKVGLWVGKENRRAAAIYRKLGFAPTSTWDIWQRMILELPKVEESGEDASQSL